MKKIGVVSVGVLIAASFILAAGSSHAKGPSVSLYCSTNSDIFSNRCVIQPNTITGGDGSKGHLAGCQYKSYSCVNGICKDNFGWEKISFTHSMDEYAKFCELICKQPVCTGKWE